MAPSPGRPRAHDSLKALAEGGLKGLKQAPGQGAQPGGLPCACVGLRIRCGRPPGCILIGVICPHGLVRDLPPVSHDNDELPYRGVSYQTHFLSFYPVSSTMIDRWDDTWAIDSELRCDREARAGTPLSRHGSRFRRCRHYPKISITPRMSNNEESC